MEQQRMEVLRSAVSARMPAVAVEHDSAVLAFIAHMGGSLMQWQVLSEGDAASYLMERTRAWLKLAGIPFSGEAPGTVGAVQLVVAAE